MTPGAPDVTIIAKAAGSIVGLKKFLEETGGIGHSLIPKSLEDQAVHLFHAKEEGIARDNPRPNFAEKVST